MSLGHAEVGQEQGYGLALHRAAAIRVEGEFTRFNVLLATALGDEAACELGTFAVSQHPARHVAGEGRGLGEPLMVIFYGAPGLKKVCQS